MADSAHDWAESADSPDQLEMTAERWRLRVRDLSRKGHFQNISFAVKQGEILGLAGLVGAGRSEIAKTIFGLARASSGSVEIFGKSLKTGNPGDI